ncbi:MAG: rhodanese-like domain-containing protein [Bacteroidia bacterium]|nr:rhodanese-like domain-containing protein [Bacteroidia bacterium]
MFGLLKKLFPPAVDFKQLIANGAVIVDVRSPGEYASGHIKNSKNIPVERIASQADQLKKSGKPVITVCKSGMRSGMASSTLKSKGIESYNGGPWNSLQNKIQ